MRTYSFDGVGAANTTISLTRLSHPYYRRRTQTRCAKCEKPVSRGYLRSYLATTRMLNTSEGVEL